MRKEGRGYVVFSWNPHSPVGVGLMVPTGGMLTKTSLNRTETILWFLLSLDEDSVSLLARTDVVWTWNVPERLPL